ncbi:DUF1697 domain-containing protein [Nocardioides okcheonensis]|uniref:DUF1697 domain-containing protein n=1 Tax=Nocardioides okcheonensis TaxID=2894081 RepID=UPI001E49C961|nr:DUF1697 domain-containing protein [Nocardioides okcheonensis]UFN46008.1 DUF1697 domain-containing protein [Nocardioides okcheonensis]
MPAYVAFLRAINLGATRKFPKAAIVAATEAAGGRDVETYINTGNVRLTHSARSVAKVQAALEEAYAAEAGFEVPTVVFTTSDLAALTARAEELHAEHEPSGQHYVTLYATAPTAAAAEAVHALAHPGETAVVDGRAAHALLDGDIHTSRLLSGKEFKALGQGTARTVKVLRTVTGKWC